MEDAITGAGRHELGARGGRLVMLLMLVRSEACQAWLFGGWELAA